MTLMDFFFQNKESVPENASIPDSSWSQSEKSAQLIPFIFEQQLPLTLDYAERPVYQSNFKIISIDRERKTYKISQENVLGTHMPLSIGMDCVLSVDQGALHTIFYGRVMGESWSEEHGQTYDILYPSQCLSHANRTEKRILVKTKNPEIVFYAVPDKMVSGLVLDVSYSGFLAMLQSPAEKSIFVRDNLLNCHLKIDKGLGMGIQVVSCWVSVRHVTRSSNGFDFEVGCKIMEFQSDGKDIYNQFVNFQWSEV